MSSNISLVQVGASQLSDGSNTVMIHAKGEDGEDFSNLSVYGTLGITSLPHYGTTDGYAQYICLVDENIAIAARDTRIADVVGQLQPGDTAVHSTGPDHQARLFLKEISKEITLISRDTDNHDCYVTVNGSRDTIQATIQKVALELSKANGAYLMTEGGYIHIERAGTITINGSKVNLGNTQLGNPLVLSPASLIALNTWLVALKATLVACAGLASGGGAPLATGAFGALFTTIAALPIPPLLASVNVFA